MKRFFGALALKGKEWRLTGEPHLLLRAKRIFGRINKREHGAVHVQDSDEVRRDFDWMLMRYPVKITPRDRKALTQGASQHKETMLRLEQLIDQKYKPGEYELAIPARDYQKRAADVFLERRFLLLGDDVGIGKSAVAICAMVKGYTLPAIVVTLAGAMPRQWAEEVALFAPKLTTHVLKKGTPYELPKPEGRGPDVLILNYHKLSKWSEVLAAYGNMVIFDEIQELRRSASNKYDGAEHVAQNVTYRIGLSATPIYNYGGELWNVTNILARDCLGTYEEFQREWCDGGSATRPEKVSVKDPKAMGSYLREHFIMLRRTRAEVGRELPEVTRIPQHVDSDTDILDNVQDAATELARIILTENETYRGEKMQAGGELDNMVRQATGIAKAPYVAEFIRLLLDSDESVLVYAWHRAVYDILNDRLEEFHPLMFTGTESVKQKEEARKQFIEKERPLMFMSLRAGAGLDGLQKACRTVVFAELDWSPGVMEQCIGRIHRDGQPDPVTAYFLVADDGCDPVMAQTLGLKRQQIEGIREPHKEIVEQLQTDPDRIRDLAEQYLKKRKKRWKKAAI